MRQRLFILLLFTVSTVVLPLALSIPRKYYLVKTPKTMDDARTYCQAYHTDLAAYESASDLLKIQMLFQSQNFSGIVWIGLYSAVNSWRWSNGDEQLGSWRKWAGLGPDDADGRSECALIFKYYWGDMSCTNTRPFMCYDDRNSGTDRYVYYSSFKTWSEARSYCRQYHTDLASARDNTENSNIQAKITLVNAATWIGLFRDSWKWMDQTPFTSVSWITGEPNNGAKDEFCVGFNGGSVSDLSCSRLLPSLCYRVITGQQQFIRIKIQSDQDVNDPAIKAEILEKIQQKLRERGVENSTVTFRGIPPDEPVFRKIRKIADVKKCGS